MVNHFQKFLTRPARLVYLLSHVHIYHLPRENLKCDAANFEKFMKRREIPIFYVNSNIH